MLTQKEKEIRAKRAVEILKEKYPDSSCALQYDGDPWRLLVMGRLSAQCTDARVNIVTKDLFQKYRVIAWKYIETPDWFNAEEFSIPAHIVFDLKQPICPLP